MNTKLTLTIEKEVIERIRQGKRTKSFYKFRNSGNDTTEFFKDESN